ncbi:MAG: ATP-binding protein [Verrucomicrobiota bacterium]
MKLRGATGWLTVTSIALLLLFLLLAITAYFSGKGVERDSVMISTDAVPGSIDAHAMKAAVGNCVRFSTLAAVTMDDGARARNLESARAAAAAFEAAFARYQATIRINPGKDHGLVDELASQFANFNRKRDAHEALLRTGDRARSLAFLESELLPAFVPVSTAADALVAYNNANADRLAQAIAANVHNLRLTTIIVVVLAVICGAILAGTLSVRRQAQEKLRENERRLRNTLDNLFVFVGLCEPDGTLVEINRSALEAAGCRREDVIGKLFHQTLWWTFSPDVQKRLLGVLQEAANGKVARFDIENRIADGNLITVDFCCGPLRDVDGGITHLVVSGIDITERKKLQEQILRAQRMEAIGTLSSGLAHDLNNILAPILMAAGLLKVKLDSPHDQKIVTMMETGAQRGAALIRQLLNFGRGSGGQRANVNFEHMIRDMVHIVEATFPRDIEVAREVGASLWPIVADSTQLHQVLLNLCVNARDAMPRGGKLLLRVENLRLDAAGAKACRIANPGNYVRLTVTDTGDGIPRAIIDRIFDPFFTTKPIGKGTGLGLSTVLGIVKSHDGFLTVDSEPGKGTTFKVYLPAVEQNDIALAAEPVAHLPRGNGETILLVDDEVAMREATKAVLEARGYHVITAGHGEDAIRLFVAHRDDTQLIVTDIDMPVMSGPELIRTVRVLEPQMKFLVMTGSTQGEKMTELAALGLGDILAKPCEPARLLKKVHAILNSTGAPALRP